jgi:hypothetical protein
MPAHDLDAPNLDSVLEPHGGSRLFLEDDPPISVEDGPPTSGEYDAYIPSVTKWTSSASAVFVSLFLILASVGGALAWWYYGGQATDMTGGRALPGATNKPTAPPEGFAELQQQLKSIATDLAAVRNTLEQLTRIQEQITQQSTALLSSSPLADKPARTPLPKPAQHPVHVSTQEHSAHVSAQDSSKPIQVAPSLPPKQ